MGTAAGPELVGAPAAAPLAPAASRPAGAAAGAGSLLPCSTAAGPIQDREELIQHYSSPFHRYNLKRKVAGLPPVTKEWFDARKAQLAQAQAAGALAAVPPGHVRLWHDPLCRKTFRTEQTYLAHTRSRKFQDAVRRSGQPAPPPTLSHKPLAELQQQEASQLQGAAAAAGEKREQGAGFKLVAPSGGMPRKQDAAGASPMQTSHDDEQGGSDDDGESGWETASDEGGDSVGPLPQQGQGQSRFMQQQQPGEEAWEEWDVTHCLFDNHVSRSLEANLEYMWRHYGFYLPDAQYLKDPEGMVKYLGAKLRYGRVPLYAHGDDANARQFRSLHAVQRHMVDCGRCRLAYDGNEDEYADFYDYEEEDDEDEACEPAAAEGSAGAAASSGAVVATGRAAAAGGGGCRELAAAGGRGGAAAEAELVSGGYELLVPGGPGQGSKVLGSRELARYYRQSHRPVDERRSVQVNTMLAKYRALGIAVRDEARSLEAKKATSKSRNDLLWEGKRLMGKLMRGNVNKNLPSCVPY